MFEKIVKSYLLNKAPSTVIPVGISIEEARKKYNLDEVVKLASNENPFGVSPKAMAAMTEALQYGHLYPDSVRDTVLKGKLAERFNVLPENLILTCGAANALAYIGELFIDAGDECIIPSPAYPPYYYIVYKNNGKIIDIPCREDDMKLDIEAILNSVSNKTRLIFLCNPNNPTSTAYTSNELSKLISKLPEDVIVVVDEAYIDFTDDANSVTMVPYLKQFPNMIVVQTFSKLYGMAGVRLGYAIACKEVITYLNKTVAARSMSTIAIEGGIAALNDDEFRIKTIKTIRNERKRLTDELRSMGYRCFDSQSNFLYADLGVTPQNLYFLLLPYGVMIRGDFPMTRITIGTPPQNNLLLSAIQDLRVKGKLS